MNEIGRFRMIDIEDLVQFRYRANRTQAEQDFRNLIHQRLTRQVRLVSPSGNRVRIVVLTARGKRFLTRHPQTREKLGKQRLYSGFVKPAEALHDASIYRMYQIEAQRIHQEGGRIRRVVLDYELKERIFRPLSEAREKSNEDLRDKQEELARRHGLKIVQGRVAFPDLRIEYETRDGQLDKRDLELATEHYRPGQLAQKQQAGFKIYFAGSVRSGGSTVKAAREITADILSS
jgi:hypothetical protein